MNRSDIMRISALFEIALGSASLIAARFWIGTTNIVGKHVKMCIRDRAYTVLHTIQHLRFPEVPKLNTYARQALEPLIFSVIRLSRC